MTHWILLLFNKKSRHLSSWGNCRDLYTALHCCYAAQEPVGRSSSVGLFAIALVEFINTTSGIDKLLLTGKERVALGADTDLVLGTGGIDFPDFAAGAHDLGRTVIRMDILFHCSLLQIFKS